LVADQIIAPMVLWATTTAQRYLLAMTLSKLHGLSINLPVESSSLRAMWHRVFVITHHDHSPHLSVIHSQQIRVAIF